MDTLLHNKDIQHVCEILKNRLYFMTIYQDKVLQETADNVYFNIDNELLYNSYYCDFGPLNLSCLYKYCCKLNQYIRTYDTKKRIVHYTISEPNKRANAAYLIGSYSVLYLGFLPRDIHKILTSNLSPPYRPFLDASQGGLSGYTIRLIDVLSAVNKARLFGFFDFNDFDVAAYDYYDLLRNGDLNWLLPRKFLAFIGPIDNAVISGMLPGINCHSAGFYVNYFISNDVRTVIRLNNKLYDETVFTRHGISHFDMYFTDGSSPPKEILLHFLHIAENSRGAIAVHCKAGLGRTGSLIGAYIVKHYHMSAREAIGWLRICRPGSVIGQQQGWLENIEKWLWRLGSSYRLECFGAGDRIPHHRYGIYSLKWKEHRTNMIQTVLKSEQNKTKISGTNSKRSHGFQLFSGRSANTTNKKSNEQPSTSVANQNLLSKSLYFENERCRYNNNMVIGSLPTTMYTENVNGKRLPQYDRNDKQSPSFSSYLKSKSIKEQFNTDQPIIHDATKSKINSRKVPRTNTAAQFNEYELAEKRKATPGIKKPRSNNREKERTNYVIIKEPAHSEFNRNNFDPIVISRKPNEHQRAQLLQKLRNYTTITVGSNPHKYQSSQGDRLNEIKAAHTYKSTASNYSKYGLDHYDQ